MDVHGLQSALLQRRGYAAHEGRFAAAGSPLEDDQIVKPCVEELVIQPIKTLRAVRAEEKMRLFHGPPPMVLVSISTYARRRVHVCVDGKCFAQKGKAPVTDAFPLIFSDAEQLALLRRELLLGEHAGVQQRFVLLELLHGARRAARLRGGRGLRRGGGAGLRRAGGDKLHQVARKGVQLVDLLVVLVQEGVHARIVVVKLRRVQLVAVGFPIGMVQLQLHHELTERRGLAELGLMELQLALTLAPLLVGAVEILHALGLHDALIVASLQLELLDTRCEQTDALGVFALGADKTGGRAGKERFLVLRDAEGLERGLFKHNGALVVLQAEESVGHIKHQLRVERAEAEAVLGMEALAQHLIFVVKIYVAAEIVERHAVQHAVRQVDLLVAFLADGHALDLGRQQAGRRVAADGAGLLIIAE